MASDTHKKIHILVMDDTLGMHMAMTGAKLEQMLDGSGADVEVKLAETKEMAFGILAEWKEQNIQPDIVSTDVLYGQYGGPAIQELSYIMEKLYDDAPELKPAKIFVHSKSGIGEGDDGYSVARRYMKELDAEYVHTDEFYAISDKFGSDRDYPDDYRSPTTDTLRQYLHDEFGIEMHTLTRKQIEANQKKLRAEQVGDNIHPCDAIHAVHDGGITPQQALMKISPEEAKRSLLPELQNRQDDGRELDSHPVVFKNAVGGAATGVAAFSADEVRQYKAEGKSVVLILDHFTPNDVGLLSEVDGVALLGRGSSHLPILCENHGIPGIFSQNGAKWGSDGQKLLLEQDDQGSKLVSINPNEEEADRRALYEFTIRSGDPVSIQTQYFHAGLSDELQVEGHFYKTGIPVMEEKYTQWWLDEPMQWAREESNQEWHRRGNHQCHGLNIKANADDAEQVKAAFELGAQGIGLLRTEHALMKGEQLEQLQTYLMADDDTIKQSALNALKAAQKKAFSEIYTEVKHAEERNYSDKTSPMRLTNLLDLPVTVRLFDAKPDEILPAIDDDAQIKRIAQDTSLSEEAVRQKLQQMHTANERGVQFGLQHEDLYKAQLEALFEAAKETDTTQQGRHTIVPEIMIPMVKTPEELAAAKQLVDEAAQSHGYQQGDDNNKGYRFGTMIETKEAVLNAGELAKQSDFFSFGTNDLTQAITGIKRDDIEAVDQWMSDNRAQNPFKTLESVVKANMQIAATEGQRANPLLKINVCGHQVSMDQPSIEFCQAQNFNGISVPANRASQVTSSIIAGQEAHKSHEIAKEENRKWRAAGGKTLADEVSDTSHQSAIDPAKLAAKRDEERKWHRG